MSSQTINISLDKELVKKMDEQAKREYSSRSDYIRKAIVNQLKTDQQPDMVVSQPINQQSQAIGDPAQTVHDSTTGIEHSVAYRPTTGTKSKTKEQKPRRGSYEAVLESLQYTYPSDHSSYRQDEIDRERHMRKKYGFGD